MSWQEQHAEVLDHEVAELEKVIAELDNAAAIVETRGREELVTQIRSTRGWLRSEMSTMTREARALRAGIAENDVPRPMPMRVTSRRVR